MDEEVKEEVKKLDWKSKLKENPWIVSTAVLGLITIIMLVLNFGGITGNVISGGSAGEDLVGFLNERVGGGVEYVSYEDLGSIYQVTVSYQGQNIPVYITKDGKYFIQGATPLSEDTSATQTQQPSNNIPKTDKPTVELFIMTHCPYGTQAEKGIIPALKVLGDSIDAKIRFVHYFMHGDKEEQETYTQVCIREEQSDKYLDYLACFLDAGDSPGCISKTSIDKTKLDNCITNKAKEYYVEDSELSNGYGVQGSPTLVINGVQASSNRSPSAYLTTICSAFNTRASGCSQTVSSDTPSAGFGYTANTAATGAAASCG